MIDIQIIFPILTTTNQGEAREYAKDDSSLDMKALKLCLTKQVLINKHH